MGAGWGAWIYVPCRCHVIEVNVLSLQTLGQAMLDRLCLAWFMQCSPACCACCPLDSSWQPRGLEWSVSLGDMRAGNANAGHLPQDRLCTAAQGCEGKGHPEINALASKICCCASLPAGRFTEHLDHRCRSCFFPSPHSFCSVLRCC